MEKHKDKALEKDCLCSKCMFRFQCFTQERVFSDPIFQGLFEALMAQGKSREEALDEVTNEIKFKMNLQPLIPLPDGSGAPNTDNDPYTYPSTAVPYIQTWGTISYYDSIGSVVINDINGETLVSYTMHDGEEVNWKV